MEDLVRLGRNFGLGCIMLTQRPQSIHKAVWSQAELAVVFQLNGPRERPPGDLVEQATTTRSL